MKIKVLPFFIFSFCVSSIVLGCAWFVMHINKEAMNDGSGVRRVMYFNLNQSMVSEYLKNPFPVEVKQVSCGRDHCYAVSKEKTLYSIGRNNLGQLGVGDRVDRAEWTKASISNVDQVSAGENHGYALIDGNVFAVGDNRNGQFGIGVKARQDELNVHKNWVFTGLRNVGSILASHNSGYAIADKKLYVTGGNSRGQLGVGHTNTLEKWTRSNIENVDSIAAHYRHAYAIVGGKVLSVGDNYRGQLANGESGFHRFQTEWVDTGLNNVSKVSAGMGHGYAIKNGGLWVVGRNHEGQLGNGSRSQSNIWIEIGIEGVSDLGGGNHFGHIVKDNMVYSTGQNDHGQLGLGLDISMGSKVEKWTATGITGVRSIESGTNFSYLVMEDGTLMSTGNNYYRKLGIDSGMAQSRFTRSVVFDKSIIPVFDVEFFRRYYEENRHRY